MPTIKILFPVLPSVLSMNSTTWWNSSLSNPLMLMGHGWGNHRSSRNLRSIRINCASVLSTSRDEFKALILERDAKVSSVLHNELLVLLLLWGPGLLQGNCQCRDSVVIWTTLVRWEDGEVVLLLKVARNPTGQPQKHIHRDYLAVNARGMPWMMGA